MDFVRIGSKILSREKIDNTVERILQLRANGFSQQEVADQLGVDRPFVSRLEAIGEVRKGAKVALVGFPIANRDELAKVAQEEGLDLVWLMSEFERTEWVREKSGAELLNDLMSLISKAKHYDTVIFIGSDQRAELVQSILGPICVKLVIGTSPMTEDRHVEPERVRHLIRSLKGSDGTD